MECDESGIETETTVCLCLLPLFTLRRENDGNESKMRAVAGSLVAISLPEGEQEKKKKRSDGVSEFFFI